MTKEESAEFRENADDLSERNRREFEEIFRAIPTERLPTYVEFFKDSFSDLGENWDRLASDWIAELAKNSAIRPQRMVAIGVRLIESWRQTGWIMGPDVMEVDPITGEYVLSNERRINERPTSFRFSRAQWFFNWDWFFEVITEHLDIVCTGMEGEVPNGEEIADSFESVALRIALAIALLYQANLSARKGDLKASIDSCALATAAHENAMEYKSDFDVVDAVAQSVKDALSERGQKGADVIQKENRGLKAEFFHWCDMNFKEHGSNTAIAEAAIKVFPLRFTTFQRWASEWRKLGRGKTS